VNRDSYFSPATTYALERLAQPCGPPPWTEQAFQRHIARARLEKRDMGRGEPRVRFIEAGVFAHIQIVRSTVIGDSSGIEAQNSYFFFPILREISS
jgi:hypothetical protein